MQFSSLGSGSRGNGTLVRFRSTLVLIDCGFTLKQTLIRLERLGVEAEALDAIFVTHEHADHISGVGVLARRFDIPVYMSEGTRLAGKSAKIKDVRIIDGESLVQLGDLSIRAVTVPHDAREPLQYVAQTPQHKLGLLTDLGCVTPHVTEHFSACDALLLEFNHDPQMLALGPYPPSLKQRVAGPFGHLSNSQAAQLLMSIKDERLRHVVVMHVSEKNNSQEAMLLELLACVDESLLSFATQDEGLAWLDLG